MVDAPGVAEAVGDDLEALLGRVIAPHAAIDLGARALQGEVAAEGIAGLEQAAGALGLADQ